MRAPETRGMSARRMTAPRAVSGKAAIPAFRELDRPAWCFGFSTKDRSRPARAAAIFGAAWPVTTRIGLAREASAASATCRTKGLPERGTTSFVSCGPALKRDDRPAARMIAAISPIGSRQGRDDAGARRAKWRDAERRFGGDRHCGAAALGDRKGTKFHAAFSVSARKDLRRREAMTSPRIAIAISPGLSAPISSPIGARMRASPSSLKPLPRIRSSLLA